MKHLIGVGEMKIEFSKTANWGQKYCWQLKDFLSFLCITVVVTRLACLLPPPFCLFICYCLGLCYILIFLCTYCKKSVDKYPVCLWFLISLTAYQKSAVLLIAFQILYFKNKMLGLIVCIIVLMKYQQTTVEVFLIKIWEGKM